MEWILLGTILIIIVVACNLAKSNQDYIDEQNRLYRENKINPIEETKNNERYN